MKLVAILCFGIALLAGCSEEYKGDELYDPNQYEEQRLERK